jgi:hypothetical protein
MKTKGFIVKTKVFKVKYLSKILDKYKMSLLTSHVYLMIAFLISFNYFFMDYSNFYLDKDVVHPKVVFIDYLHVLTSPINQWFVDHPSVSWFFIVIQSLLCDFTFLIISLNVLVNKHVYAVLGSIIGMSLRQLMLFFVRFPIPSNMIWYNPNIPTLTADYSQTDFYFSGHTMSFTFFLAYTFMYEWNNKKLQRLMQIYAIFALCYIVSLLIIFRIHYTADIFTGFILSLLVSFTYRYYEIKSTCPQQQ